MGGTERAERYADFLGMVDDYRKASRENGPLFATSHHDYRVALDIAALDPPLAALIMAAMRRADPHHATRLSMAFPDTWREFQQREVAPGGSLPHEKP